MGKSIKAVDQHGLHTQKGVDAAVAGGDVWGKAVEQYAGFFQNVEDSERSLLREAGKPTARIPELHHCITEELNPSFNKAEKRFNQLASKLDQEKKARKNPEKQRSAEKPAPELSPAPGVNKTQNSPFRILHDEI